MKAIQLQLFNIEEPRRDLVFLGKLPSPCLDPMKFEVYFDDDGVCFKHPDRPRVIWAWTATQIGHGWDCCSKGHRIRIIENIVKGLVYGVAGDYQHMIEDLIKRDKRSA